MCARARVGWALKPKTSFSRNSPVLLLGKCYHFKAEGMVWKQMWSFSGGFVYFPEGNGWETWTLVTFLFQKMTVWQKPAVRPLMRATLWETWRISAGTLAPEFGWRTGRSSPLCLAPLWPLTVAGAACWEPARWCWLRHFCFISWAEVSGGVMVKQNNCSHVF